MRRTIILTIITGLCFPSVVFSQQRAVELINEYGAFDHWSVRSVKESGIIGGKTKFLYEFYGDGDTLCTREPFVSPDCYLWRTNNVLAVVAGVVKTNTTVFPEKRGKGYCARIETHIEEVKALGIVNMDVTCQGAIFIGSLPEPIRDTKNPMAKVLYGIPFNGRPSALVFDCKADVGHKVVRGTGFSKLKVLEDVDYPEVCMILQKRWEDEDGNIHALRVGTAMERFMKNIPQWENGHRLEVKYGDISSEPYYRDYMGLMNNPETAFYAINSKGEKTIVHEDGWAPKDTHPNCLIIKFISSCGKPFYGGVGNTLWIDNVKIEM